MSDGNGNSDDGLGETEETTPQQVTLALHRPYVAALANCISPLHQAVLTLREVLHEMRVAQEPVSRKLLRNISLAGEQIAECGQQIADQFSK